MTPDQPSPETIQVDFSLGAGHLGMNVSVRVPSGEVSITQLLPVLQEITNDVVGGVAQVFEAGGQPISCRAGCGACCRQMVPLSLFEAEALAAWIGTLPQQRQDELLARFSAATEQLREHGVLEQMGNNLWNNTAEASVKLMLDYLHARVPCPFLEEESCGIHPIRPLICREYLVTSPAEYCYGPVKEKLVRIDLPVKPSNSLFRMGSRIERNRRGWLPLIFLADWMKAGGKPGQSITGTGPEVLYAFLQDLSPEAKDEQANP